MERIINLIRQYRYGFLILLLGVGLMLIQTGKTDDSQPPTPVTGSAEITLEEKLSEILSRMEGVGKAEVLLTLALGEETIFETREDSNESDASDRYSREPVIITDSNRAEQGLVQQVIPPVFRGAIVVCEGGESPAIKLAIVEAVSDVTGLTADKISVLKMK
jgi:stage III sporulation protein AG